MLIQVPYGDDVHISTIELQSLMKIDVYHS